MDQVSQMEKTNGPESTATQLGSSSETENATVTYEEISDFNVHVATSHVHNWKRIHYVTQLLWKWKNTSHLLPDFQNAQQLQVAQGELKHCRFYTEFFTVPNAFVFSLWDPSHP